MKTWQRVVPGSGDDNAKIWRAKQVSCREGTARKSEWPECHQLARDDETRGQARPAPEWNTL